MKRLQAVVWLLAAFACSGLEAQTTIMKADIPFDFKLGKSTMPAGEYRINYSGSILSLRSEGGHHNAMVLTTPMERAEVPKTGVLEFNRYDDTYFFVGVWAPGSAAGGTVWKTKQEKELASRATTPLQPATIALSKSR
jgi:hypothetical protein